MQNYAINSKCLLEMWQPYPLDVLTDFCLTMNTGVQTFRTYRALFNIGSGNGSMPLPEQVFIRITHFRRHRASICHNGKILGLIELDSGITDTCQFVGNWPEVANANLVTTQPPYTEGMFCFLFWGKLNSCFYLRNLYIYNVSAQDTQYIC